jgi:hypothetical protein
LQRKSAKPKRWVLCSLNSPLEWKQENFVLWRYYWWDIPMLFNLNQVRRPRIVQITVVSHETLLSTERRKYNSPPSWGERGEETVIPQRGYEITLQRRPQHDHSSRFDRDTNLPGQVFIWMTISHISGINNFPEERKIIKPHLNYLMK